MTLEIPAAAARTSAAAVPPPDPAPAAGLRLSEGDSEIVSAEARALAAAFQDRERRAGLQQLAAEADEQLIPPALIPELERLLDMGLQTGRFRGRYGPGGETAMVRLFSRTPRGAQIAQRVSAANAALAALSGQTLQQLSFTVSGWGSYSLHLKTDLYSVRIAIDANGVQAENLEVGA